MLVLTLKPGESIRIGDAISVTASEIIGHGVKLGIEAPREVVVLREELLPSLNDAGNLSEKKHGKA